MPTKRERSNLVLITADSLRHDFVSWHQEIKQREVGPLRHLAYEGFCFTQAISVGPRTATAFPAILASVYPFECGEGRIPKNAPTLAEVLSSQGYQNLALGPDIPFLEKEGGWERGFVKFHESWRASREGLNDPELPASSWKRRLQDWVGKSDLGVLFLLQAALLRSFEKGSDGMVETCRQFRRWIGEAGENPFFIWVHIVETRFPYFPDVRERSLRSRLRFSLAALLLSLGRKRFPMRIVRSLYRQSVRRAENQIAALLDILKETGQLSRTVVALTADHGEMFEEHGSLSHGPQLYDELIRVPMWIRAPNCRPREVNDQVSLIDLAPTLLDLLSVPAPDSYMGCSFSALLEGRPSGKRYAFSQVTHWGGRKRGMSLEGRYRMASCRSLSWKYIWDEDGGREELYDLREDPGEARNLKVQDSNQGIELRGSLEQHLDILRERRRLLYSNETDRVTTSK